MRIKSLICWDIKTQIKYGFYLLYAILTLLYILVLFAVPETWRETLAVILIFSDPAAMGMFFMGAIVLLEKSQRVPCAFAVSPVSSGEYVAAKMISMCVISVLVSGILAAASGIHPIGYVLAGTALSSLIFTLLGIIVAANIGSLNQFVLMTIPFEIICFVPAGLQVFGEILPFFRFYPPNICVSMVAGYGPKPEGLVNVIAFIAVLFFLSCKCVRKMWNSMGGVKL